MLADNEVHIFYKGKCEKTCFIYIDIYYIDKISHTVYSRYKVTKSHMLYYFMVYDLWFICGIRHGIHYVIK